MDLFTTLEFALIVLFIGILIAYIHYSERILRENKNKIESYLKSNLEKTFSLKFSKVQGFEEGF